MYKADPSVRANPGPSLTSAEDLGMQPVLGIDIGKDNFHAVVLEGDGEHAKSFPNNQKGFVQLDAWLRNRKLSQVHACLEATGAYGEALATHLHERGHQVSVVNPARIKGFGQSELVRTKTDAVDAGVIARFCKAQQPELWTPPAPEIRTLQGLTRRLSNLLDARQQEHNRVEIPGVVAPVVASIRAHIDHLSAQITALEQQIHDHIDQHPTLRDRHDLLTTIPGVGAKTAATILGELPDIERFASAKQVSAFVGLSPQLHQSGKSVRGKTRLSKKGNSRLRKALFFPALSALRCNPLITRFAERLRTAGKSKMLIVGAVMRKLLHIVYGILRTGTPFDPKINTAQA
jgi:transposase